MYYSLDYIRDLLNLDDEIVDAGLMPFSDITDKFTKTSFSTFKLKPIKKYAEFIYNDRKIQVLQYLPIVEKNDIIEVAYQKSIIENKFNPLLFNIYFTLNIIYSYTNLTFTDEQRKDEMKLYDLLMSHRIVESVLMLIPKSELIYFPENITDYVSNSIKMDYSAVGLINNGIQAVNKMSSVIQEKMSTLDDATVEKLLNALPTLISKPNESLK